MESDFHYFGTGAAAFDAGFDAKDSQEIAFAAQFVDWFNTIYFADWHIVDSDGKAVRNKKDRKQYIYKTPQLSIQSIGLNLAFGYDEHIWNAYHFPPGNLEYEDSATGWRKLFCSEHVVRKTNLSKKDCNKLCRPYSEFARDLVLDTREKFQALYNAKDESLEKLIKRYVGKGRIRCPVYDGKFLARILLGIRMHVFVDTWAHQDFTGEQNKRINYAGFLNSVVVRNKNGKKFEAAKWTGMLSENDCFHARAIPIDAMCGGHGQIGMLPDFSWLTFKYPAEWLPADSSTKLHTRKNPDEYTQAWSWMRFAMALCNGSQNDSDRPIATPKPIAKVIGTWHRRSTESLQAIASSEQAWRKTSLVKNFHDPKTPKNIWKKLGISLHDVDNGMWGNLKNKQSQLGVHSSITDGDWIDVKQNGILHYMEIASAMHYNFCYQWTRKNKDYSWRAEKPLT